MNERIERMHHMYDGGPKPKHFDDKSIVDMEKWNSMKGLEKKTRTFWLNHSCGVEITRR